MSLSKNAAFWLLASLVLFFLAGSSAPTPLYSVYQAQWGFAPIVTTLIFGVYAIAVLGALLVLGSLSDYIGRRPVLLAATLLQAGAMLLYATAHSVSGLVGARVLQGIATGAAAGAIGAAMIDLDRQRGALANAISPMLGTGTGSLASGLLVQYLPLPTTLVYAVFGVIYTLQLLALLMLPESVARRPGAFASLKPNLQLPARARRPLLLAIPALFGAWALVGFYGSLGPALTRRLADTHSLALGGLTLAVLSLGGVLSVLLTRKYLARQVLMIGTVGLVLGGAVTLLAIEQNSITLFFMGTLLAGGGFGAAFQGAIQSVVPLALAHERAGVLSVLYVVAYLAMGLPAVLGGYRVGHGGGLLGTATEYAASVMLLAALALIGTLLQRAPVGATAPAPGRS